MEDGKSREQTFMEKMHDLGTNFIFNMSGWSFKSSAPFKKEDKVNVQGKEMNNNKDSYEKNQREVLEAFQNIIWITYRKNFLPLLNHNNAKQTEYISDTGWGCMVRVGQMAFAEGLRRHLTEHNKLTVKKKEDLRPIISGFFDDDNMSADLAPYSIQKISKIALGEFNLLPGEWYTPIRICYILGLLHNEKKCIPGTEDLKVSVFSSSRPIVFEDILEVMCKIDESRGKHAKICGMECRHQKNSDHLNLAKKVEPELEVIEKAPPPPRLICPIHHELQNSILIYIVCLIGLDTPQQEYLQLALKMMDFKYSLGLIGGKPKKALYFVGRIGDELIYLDPHYVQESTSEKNFSTSAQFETYFCKKLQTYSAQNIDSSFSLVYYLKDLHQLEEFYQFMMQLKNDYKDNFFMMMEDVEPSFVQGDGKFSSNLISKSNLELQNLNRIKKEQQKANKYTDEVENIDEEEFNNGNSHHNGNNHKQNQQNQNNKNKKVEHNAVDDDDDYEVI